MKEISIWGRALLEGIELDQLKVNNVSDIVSDKEWEQIKKDNCITKCSCGKC